ncbi:MAG: helix-turn-helix transcriptional regulator [Eubacteriales bacterium]|nr:helix-turn-helix transcriptional regulator [Eubacteriales bacterium]
MRISYNKLWNLLNDNKMKKSDLARAAQLSEYMLARLSHNEPVGLDTMQKICKVFHCNIGDVMDMIEEEKDTED